MQRPSVDPALRRRARASALRRTLHGFAEHDCSDLAAGLVYHAAFAALPALLAVVSLLGLVGQAEAVVDGLIRLVALLAPGAGLERTLRPALDALVRSPAAPFTFGAGVLGALWSASNYTAAFGRAMDRVWGVAEGRSWFAMRGQLALLTIVLVVLAAAGAALAVLAPAVVRPLGAALGVGGAAVAVLEVTRWPVLVALAVLLVSLLYAWTPDARSPGLRRVGPGSALALVAIAVASGGLAVYAAHFDRYETAYGAIGSVILVLLWLWVAHLALLLGAVLDAERERARELLLGMPAEESILVDARNRSGAAKRAAVLRRDVDGSRAVRTAAESAGDGTSTGSGTPVG